MNSDIQVESLHGTLQRAATLYGLLSNNTNLAGNVSVGKVQINRVDGAKIYTDTTENWNRNIGYIPKEGEIIVYTDRAIIMVDGEERLIPGIKLGTGVHYLSDLPFIDAMSMKLLDEHLNDNTRHITQQERVFWNNKLNQTVSDECLIFNRD